MTATLEKTSHTVPDEGFVPSHGKGRRELLAASVGGIVEGFDWTIYAVMAPYLAVQLFPGDSPVAKLLAAYVGFAVGFVARPLGSILIGWWADRRGRRSALVLSMVTIALANLVIALTPTAAVIGVGAAIIVVLARVFMGISFGGEIPSGAAYVTETAPAKRRFSYSAVASLGGVIGPILAFITLAILLGTYGAEGVTNGGWRVAFIVAAAAGLVALWIRTGVRESNAFLDNRTPVRRWAVLRANSRLVIATFFACAGGTVAFYLGTVYLPVYADMHGVIARPNAERMMPAALLVMLVVMLIAGRLADRFGAFNVFRTGFLLLAVGTGPLLIALRTGAIPFIGAAVIYLSCFGLVLAQANVIFSQLFPTSIRVIGYGIPYTISAAVFGGTTPAVAQSLAASGRPSGVIWYASAAAVVSALATLLIRRSDIKVQE
ncbi:MFS transporter [Allorhizocola rhizosphaerae]|uniref:MFS transporter n=1 Tax=Allorhizocola rhizosphaerae TaxID=1872709 RepID=UPI000E3B6135|nr:MFS transporter [Allorhizocola rhizosphaerae]